MFFPNLVFAVPTINNESQCNETTLLTADGGANLRAEWTPNTIRLQWDAGDNATFTDPTENDASYSCAYGGGITLPDEPYKTGYNFRGWRLQPPFDLRTLSDNIEINSNLWLVHIAPLASNNNQPKCLESSHIKDCDDPMFKHLDENEWSVTFSYGSIKGESVCATNSGHFGEVGTPIGTDGPNCWCRANGFARQNSSKYQSVASPAWVYQAYNPNNCASGCVFACASNLGGSNNNNNKFRRGIFGVTE